MSFIISSFITKIRDMQIILAETENEYQETFVYPILRQFVYPKRPFRARDVPEERGVIFLESGQRRSARLKKKSVSRTA